MADGQSLGGAFYQAIGEQMSKNARSFRLFFYADGAQLVLLVTAHDARDAEEAQRVGSEAIAAAMAECSGCRYDARSRAVMADVVQRAIARLAPRSEFFVVEMLDAMKP